jgi:hypothetical protein
VLEYSRLHNLAGALRNEAVSFGISAVPDFFQRAPARQQQKVQGTRADYNRDTLRLLCEKLHTSGAKKERKLTPNMKARQGLLGGMQPLTFNGDYYQTSELRLFPRTWSDYSPNSSYRANPRRPWRSVLRADRRLPTGVQIMDESAFRYPGWRVVFASLRQSSVTDSASMAMAFTWQN